MAAKGTDREGAKFEHFGSLEEFLVAAAAKQSEKEARREAREAEKAAAEQPAKQANSRERRNARKVARELAEQDHERAAAKAAEELEQTALLTHKRKREARTARKVARELAEQEHERAVAKAAEDLEQTALLTRKRKREAARIIKLDALEKEKSEHKKLITKPKEDLKHAGSTTTTQIHAAEKLAEQKKFTRTKIRADDDNSIATATTEAKKVALEEPDRHPKKKLKQERHKLELELGQPARIDEQRWLKFKADTERADEAAALRIKILEEAVSKHTRSEDTRSLRQTKAWKTRTIVTRKRDAIQAKAKEDSFALAGITEATDTSFLAALLQQQQMLIEYAQKRKRGSSADDESDLDKGQLGGSAKDLSQKLNSDLRRAEGTNNKSSTGADMWSTPFKQPVSKEQSGWGELGALGAHPSYLPSRQPMKLEALSTYKQGDKLDAMTWFKAARVRLKNQASLGFLFSEEGAIAAIMDRAEVGSTIATWYQAQTNPEVLSNMAAFESAFTRRFASGRTVEAALDRLSTIKSTSFVDLDLFYTEFCDLTSIVGTQRSKPDLVRNFLDAVPPNMRTLIMLKNPGIRTTATMAIDELFLLAKEIAAAEKMGGAKQAVLLIEHGGTDDTTHDGEAPGIFPVGGTNLGGRGASGAPQSGGFNQHISGGGTITCRNCNSSAHLTRDCTQQRLCFNCNQPGHSYAMCTSPRRANGGGLDNRRPTDEICRDFRRGDCPRGGTTQFY